MKKILILFIAMISFASMKAMTVHTSDNDTGDKITKVVDVGNSIIAMQEVSADAFSTALSTNSVDTTSIVSGSAFVTAQTNSSVLANIPDDVGWRNSLVNKAVNLDKLYRRTDHDYLCSRFEYITLNYTKIKGKRNTIRFPTK